MLSLAEDYLTERRALGFDLRIPGTQITAFARFVDAVGHTGPLTTRITLDWVQGHARHAKPFSWARRLDVLRPFARYLARLDPATEFPQTAIFGRSHRRLAPHIYSEQEIRDLLAAARPLDRDSVVYVAGHRGLVGSAIWRHLEAEGFTRGRYGGAVGWVDSAGDGTWAVSIRCAELSADRRSARLVAGGGIVADSEPLAELAETQAKLQAMLSAIVRP